MNNAERVTEFHPRQDDRRTGRELATRTSGTVVPRSARRESSGPLAVSQSSYLNEKDRHYRAAETVENGTDLAQRSVSGVLRIDAKLQQAQADGASPRALVAIERIEDVLGQTGGMLLFDYMARPYERW
jgi:hypothetical protein